MKNKIFFKNIERFFILFFINSIIIFPTFALDYKEEGQKNVVSKTEQRKIIPSKLNLSNNAVWPKPIDDSALHSYILFDNFEYQMGEGADPLSWDVLSWYGGDIERLWFKSEGRSAFNPKQGESEIELQALYGKLISPFFDLQAGVRVDPRVEDAGDPSRIYGVLGVQGLAPYYYDIEPTLFLSERGQLSGRLTTTYDILFTQRLILQPRLESTVALGRDSDIGVGPGLNDLELGVRLRYEILRRFAPYVGLSWLDKFGATRSLALDEGRDSERFMIVGGIRFWL